MPWLSTLWNTTVMSSSAVRTCSCAVWLQSPMVKCDGWAAACLGQSSSTVRLLWCPEWLRRLMTNLGGRIPKLPCCVYFSHGGAEMNPDLLRWGGSNHIEMYTHLWQKQSKHFLFELAIRYTNIVRMIRRNWVAHNIISSSQVWHIFKKVWGIWKTVLKVKQKLSDKAVFANIARGWVGGIFPFIHS